MLLRLLLLSHGRGLRSSKAPYAALIALVFLSLFAVGAATGGGLLGAACGVKRGREPLAVLQPLAVGAAAVGAVAAAVAAAVHGRGARSACGDDEDEYDGGGAGGVIGWDDSDDDDELPDLLESQDEPEEGDVGARRPRLHAETSDYYQYLKTCCGGNEEYASFIDGVLSIIPNVMTHDLNCGLYESAIEVFTTKRPWIWAAKAYFQVTLTGDREVLSTEGAEGRLRRHLMAYVDRVDSIMLPLGYENAQWAEIMAMGKTIKLVDGRTATGTSDHQDQGEPIKVLGNAGPDDSGRGLGFAGGGAPRGCKFLYPKGGVILGTAEGFLQPAHGGREGLKHYSVEGHKPAVLIVLRYRLIRPEFVTTAHHPDLEARLSAAPRDAQPSFDFSTAAAVLEKFTGWQEAPDSVFEAMAMHSAMSRGGVPKTAGKLQFLVRNMLSEQIPKMSARDFASAVHSGAADVAGCCLPGCSLRYHNAAHTVIAQSSVSLLPVDVSLLLEVTGVAAAYSSNTPKQLFAAAASGTGSAAARSQMHALLVARQADLAATGAADGDETVEELRAARAAGSVFVPPPTTCTLKPCAVVLTEDNMKRFFDDSAEELTAETRFLWGCSTCHSAMRKGRLELDWSNNPVTWEWLRGGNTAAGQAAKLIAVDYVLPLPPTCMVPHCSAELAPGSGANQTAFKAFQFPAGAARVAKPRYIWCCNACCCKSRKGKLRLDWSDEGFAAMQQS